MSNSKKQQEQQITILPSYEDVEIQINSLFTPIVLSGGRIKFHHNHPLKIDEYEFRLDGSTEFRVASVLVEGNETSITGVIPIRVFSASIGTSILEYGAVEMKINNNGALVGTLSAFPSPFLLGNFQCVYSDKQFQGLLSINARQQISNITARFSMNKIDKPVFEQATALFGSRELAIGLRFQFDDERKKNYQVLVHHMLNRKTTLLADLTFNDLRKQFLFSSSIVKQSVKGLQFGAQFKIQKDLKREFNIGWDLTLGKNRVKSLISTNKVISTYFSRRILKGLTYEISATLEYGSKNASLGIGLIYDS